MAVPGRPSAALPSGSGPAAGAAPRDGAASPRHPPRGSGRGAAVGDSQRIPARAGRNRVRRGSTGRDDPRGKPPKGRWREGGQLTRAVAPAHGAGEQEGACEQTESGSGRCSAPAPPAPIRSPRYPPRRSGANHMAARRARAPGKPRAEESRGEQHSTRQHSLPTELHCRGLPSPPRSCTIGSSRRAPFKRLPGRMSTGAGEGGRGGREGGSGQGLGGSIAGQGPAGAAVSPPSTFSTWAQPGSSGNDAPKPPQAPRPPWYLPPPRPSGTLPLQTGSGGMGTRGEHGFAVCLSKSDCTQLKLPSTCRF